MYVNRYKDCSGWWMVGMRSSGVVCRQMYFSSRKFPVQGGNSLRACVLREYVAKKS
jgi:hypothetical protein